MSNHYAGGFMSEDRRERYLRIGTRAGELVAVVAAGGFDLDQDLAGFRPAS